MKTQDLFTLKSYKKKNAKYFIKNETIKQSVKTNLLIIIFIIFSISLSAQKDEKAYLTTGFKIGEVSESSVIIWTRLCESEKPNPIVHQRNPPPFRSPIDFNEDMPVEQMDGAVKGTDGEARAIIKANGKSIASEWKKVDAGKDFTAIFQFNNLSPFTKYEVVVEARKSSNHPTTSLNGNFKTAPTKNLEVPVLFTASSDQAYWDFDDSIRGFKIYDSMQKLHPDFFVHQGDYIYYDLPGPFAVNIEKACYKWNRMNAWPALSDFFKQTPIYMEKDDHDLLQNDCYPSISPYGELSFPLALDIWREHVPLIGLPYRTYRWGKDLQIWLVDNREYRSNNNDPDGPDKTIWGKEQKKWFINTVEASDATFKILLSSTPIVGPDRSTGKSDNYSNAAFQTEGDWLRRYLSKHSYMYVVNGDRHWQYVSVDKKTGLLEFDHGPASNSHADGWDPNDVRPEHKFLRVKGGFIGVKVERIGVIPQITFTLYDVDGKVVHTEIIQAK